MKHDREFMFFPNAHGSHGLNFFNKLCGMKDDKMNFPISTHYYKPVAEQYDFRRIKTCKSTQDNVHYIKD